MLLFRLAACCCCFPTSSPQPAQPIPPRFHDALGNWVCENGDAWTFRPDGTYRHRTEDTAPIEGGITGYWETHFELDGRSFLGASMVETTVSIYASEGCLGVNGKACTRVGVLPSSGQVGMWDGWIPADATEIRKGRSLVVLDPGEGAPLEPQQEVWITRTEWAPSGVMMGRRPHFGFARDLGPAIEPEMLPFLREGAHLRLFVDPGPEPMSAESQVFEVVVRAVRDLPDGGIGFWRSIPEGSTGEAVQRLSGRRDADPDPTVPVFGFQVRHVQGERQQESNPFSPVRLDNRPELEAHRAELTPGSRLRIPTGQGEFSDVVVVSLGAPPEVPGLPERSWDTDQRHLLIRNDGFAQSWSNGTSHGGVLVAGVEAQVEVCGLPPVPTGFEVDGDAVIWEGGTLHHDPGHDLRVINEAAAAKAEALELERRATRSSGGSSDYDRPSRDYDWD